jgi:hypothetical protein
MAYSAASLTATELSYFAADKPMLASNSAKVSNLAEGYWRLNATGTLVTVTAAVFTGTGLDDLTAGSTYTGDTNGNYEVEIDATGTPDTFKWRKDAGAYTTGVAITGAAQTLAEGVTVTFAATTGHTLGDKWDIAVQADLSQDDYPVSALFDGLPGVLSKPRLSSTDFSIVFDFGSSGITIDAWTMIGHNMGDAQEAVADMSLQIANDNLFTSNLITIGAWSPNGASYGQRWSDLVLKSGATDAQRYSGVRYARILVEGTGSHDPYIGQIGLLRRRQLQYSPWRPYDDVDQHTELAGIETDGGVFYDTVRFKGRRHLSAALNQLSTAQASEVLSWWEEIERGGKYFYWWDRPSTYPYNFTLQRQDEPMLNYPFVGGGGYRNWGLTAREQGPYFQASEEDQ